MTAGRRYREITAELAAIVEYIRQVDGHRLTELARSLGELDDAMVKAAEREGLTRLGVALHWEAALEALWTEQWMTLRPLPEPDMTPTRRSLSELDEEVANRYQALLAAVNQRGLGIARRQR